MQIRVSRLHTTVKARFSAVITGFPCLSRMFSRAVVLWLLAVLALQGQGTKGSSSEEMRPNPAAATPESSTLASCPAGGPLGEMEVTVHTSSNQPLPFINIVHLTEGDVVDYKPIDHGR